MTGYQIVLEAITEPSDYLQSKFDDAIRRIKIRFKYNLNYMQLKVSDIPINNKGKPYRGFKDIRAYGASWTKLKTIFTGDENHLKEVMKYYKVKMTLDNFILMLYCHELGHEVYRNKMTKSEIAKTLEYLKKIKFHTKYLDHIKPDKMDEEMVAEYIAKECMKI